jgi:hypothetical protein
LSAPGQCPDSRRRSVSCDTLPAEYATVDWEQKGENGLEKGLCQDIGKRLQPEEGCNWVADDHLRLAHNVISKRQFKQLTSLKSLFDRLERLSILRCVPEGSSRAGASIWLDAASDLVAEALKHASSQRADGKVAINLSAFNEAISELDAMIEALEQFMVAACASDQAPNSPSIKGDCTVQMSQKRLRSLDHSLKTLRAAVVTGAQSVELVHRPRSQLDSSDGQLELKLMERLRLLSIIDSLEILQQMRCLQEQVVVALHARRFDEANRLCRVFDELHRTNFSRDGYGTVLREATVFRSLSESFLELAARSLRHMYQQVHGLCFAFNASQFQSIWTAYESLGAEQVLAERFAQAYEHLFVSARAWMFDAAQQQTIRSLLATEPGDDDRKGEKDGNNQIASLQPAVRVESKQQSPLSVTEATWIENRTDSGTKLDRGRIEPLKVLDNCAGLVSVICLSLRQLFDHPLVDISFRTIVWTSIETRMQAESALLTKRLHAEQQSWPQLSPVDLWRSLLALHAVCVQWDSLQSFQSIPENGTIEWEHLASMISSPRPQGGSERDLVPESADSESGTDATRPSAADQIAKGCTLPLVSTYDELARELCAAYVGQYKRSIESRFLEIFSSEIDWQTVTVHIDQENSVLYEEASQPPFPHEASWTSFLHMVREWYAVNEASWESNLVVQALEHEVAHQQPKELLYSIWTRLRGDEGLAVPDDYTFTSASVFVLECFSVLAAMLYSPTNLKTDSVPGCFAVAIEKVARFAMYLLAVVYAPCFVTSGILSGRMVQLDQRSTLRPPMSAYQDALWECLLSERDAATYAGGSVRRPRSEFHLGKFCFAVESAWTIGQTAALVLEMGATFQERMLSLGWSGGDWRRAFVGRALRSAKHLRGLADVLRLVLYRSVASSLMESASVIRNVTQALTQKPSWWQSLTPGTALNAGAHSTTEKKQETSVEPLQSEVTVSVAKANLYVSQISGSIRSLRRSAQLPVHAEDFFWRSCVLAALMAVQEGIALVPVASMDIQVVSQALFDAKTLIAELEEELGCHPLPYASELCQYIQMHLAPLPRILHWIASRRETLGGPVVQGLVHHAVCLGTGDEAAVRAFTDGAIEQLLQETIAMEASNESKGALTHITDEADCTAEVPIAVLTLDAL